MWRRVDTFSLFTVEPLGRCVRWAGKKGHTPLLPLAHVCPTPAALQVTFHDTVRMRKRIPLLSDFFGFTAASLGEKARR